MVEHVLAKHGTRVRAPAGASMLELILITIIILLAIIIYILYSRLKAESSVLSDLEHDHKSMFVKHGKAWEHFVPFTSDFEKIASKENFRFMGSPIDGISFDEDAIKFIEIKTGTSELSGKQKKIKKQVQEKNVEWHELRY